MIGVLTIALAIILVITSILLIILVLLHRGKGGGLSELFGGGISSSVGGSSVAEKNLDRLTIGIGLIWAAAIVAVGLLVRTT
jgi:preprotein translocase subunit SecG